MSTVDVRNGDVKPIVNMVIFSSSENGTRGMPGVAYAVRRPERRGVKKYPYIVDGCDEFVYIRTEEDADNLIKAIEVAKKEGFWDDNV